MSLWQIASLAGRGRGLIATQPIAAGSLVLTSTPVAQVVKQAPARACDRCLDETRDGCAYCSPDCEDAAVAEGAALLARVDLSQLHAVHAEEGRKFPLMIAQLLGGLLEGLRRDKQPPPAWQAAMSLCYADLPPQATDLVESERLALLRAFAESGVSSSATLELLMPHERYARLLGAAQLNAFGITTARGAVLTALLGGAASMLNHSCDPSVLVSHGADHSVGFVTDREVAPGDELTISYMGLDSSCTERQELLTSKYGFACAQCAELGRG
jgi:hypothetical protein